jgi:hypothetical protein
MFLGKVFQNRGRESGESVELTGRIYLLSWKQYKCEQSDDERNWWNCWVNWREKRQLE